MPSFIPTIIRRLFLWSNVPLVIALICSAYMRYSDPATLWLAGFAGLAFPFLWVINLCYIGIWLFYLKKYRYWMLPLAGAFLTIPAIFPTWGFHAFDNSKPATKKSFTLMTFNCSSMGMSAYQDRREIRENIYDVLCKTNPDVLCLQEFYSNDHPEKTNNLDSLCGRLKYPYHYFVKRLVQWDTWNFGTVLFSKYPITDTAMVELGGGHAADDMLTANLLVHGDTMRIVSVHLASYQLKNGDYNAVNSSDAGKIKGLVDKMRRSLSLRSEQSQLVREQVATSKHPVIVVGDFNDIPLSHTYNTIRGNDLQDAFLQQGFGFGRTFSSLARSLRIDYILPGRNFSIENFSIIRSKDFEHFPIMARLSLQN